LRHQIPPTALVYDLVYNPLETPLLREAAHAGAGVLGGIQMLVHQGAASFEMWTGRPAPVEVMLGAAVEAMRARSQE
jgi:shikimate 5-dehydrogenase